MIAHDAMSILARTEEVANGSNAIENVLAPMLMVVGVVLLGFILIGSVRGKIARRDAATPTPREQVAQARSRAGARDDLHAAEAELAATARRLAAQLDAKAERLDRLVDEAEQRIASLRRLMEDAEALLTGPGPDPGPGWGEIPAGGPAEHAAAARPASPSALPADPLTASVYELADAGRDPVEIARQLDEQIGKVELILALRGDDR
ncbi:MAG: hypothetical protein SYC29_17785 [Planctomycetota bacterium]|nr:hypothetical protein [Planctomycetota bacterium]